MSQVLVFGESLIDLIETGQQGPAGNPVYEACPGGSPYNAALALAAQGAEVGYACPLSTDPYGALLAARLAEFGTTYAYPKRVAAPTSLAVVSSPGGRPAYQFYRSGVADRAANRATLRALSLPAWVQIGGLALAPEADGAFWLEHLRWLVDQGVKLSIDPNVRAAFIDDLPEYRNRIRTICSLATLVKMSDEDAEVLFPEGDAIALLGGIGVPLVALTRGIEGAVLARLGEQVVIPAQPADPLGDTVGAGDTFGAAVLAQVLAGEEDLARLGHYAAAAARLNCQQIGCHPPTAAQTRTALLERVPKAN